MLQLLYVLVTFTCAPVTPFGIRIYSIPSAAMEPNLRVGSFIAADRCAYGISRFTFDAVELPIARGRFPNLMPARGDIVVFRPPRELSTVYVKRVIGLPGDRVELKDGRLVLNGVLVDRQPAPSVVVKSPSGDRVLEPTFRESLVGGSPYTIVLLGGEGDRTLRTVPPVTVPAGHLYVLGDNRDNSVDSRLPERIGFVPVENVVGKVVAAGPWLVPSSQGGP